MSWLKGYPLAAGLSVAALALLGVAWFADGVALGDLLLFLSGTASAIAFLLVELRHARRDTQLMIDGLDERLEEVTECVEEVLERQDKSSARILEALARL